jgi:hypothetical protein
MTWVSFSIGRCAVVLLAGCFVTLTMTTDVPGYGMAVKTREVNSPSLQFGLGVEFESQPTPEVNRIRDWPKCLDCVVGLLPRCEVCPFLPSL